MEIIYKKTIFKRFKNSFSVSFKNAPYTIKFRKFSFPQHQTFSWQKSFEEKIVDLLFLKKKKKKKNDKIINKKNFIIINLYSTHIYYII